MTRPLLAITLGDPAGIGPEVVLKALAHPEVYERSQPLVVGDRRILERAAGWLGQTVDFEVVAEPSSGSYAPGKVTLLDLENAPPEQVPVGEVSAAAGAAAVEYVFRACDLAMAGAVDAVVTAPLNKAAMNLAGFDYAGHTELLTERTGAERVSMLLIGPNLRIVHVSTHVGLAEAIARVTPERVDTVIQLAHDACRALGIARPRIAVAGLNPHASEGGLFGDEEATRIEPAIRAARERGLDVSDPQPPDTVFLRATKGAYDIVVAQYHDQGHIPMKLLAFDSGVNVSYGLPIIRTSVDHGTAFDIAGRGIASESSLLAAIDVAVHMAHARAAPPPG
ncbi:MAG: 4-hydroxythreonine-4-phosphate dehydrogenase [Thermomicrobiales bacterium]|jgi:4-hydroxythreonine-4-phosphate dehydrogenase|nr:4-hydroxythreonine-4-phosphate dehydrogenase [Thermomicrobiales bacterium]